MSARPESISDGFWEPDQGVTISTGSCDVSRVAYSAWFVLPPVIRNVYVPLPVMADFTLTSTHVPPVVVARFARRGALPMIGALFQVMPLWVQLLLTR